jgi:hypothetical protein
VQIGEMKSSAGAGWLRSGGTDATASMACARIPVEILVGNWSSLAPQLKQRITVHCLLTSPQAKVSRILLAINLRAILS